MENQVTIFTNEEFGNVRTVMINDKPYFCASDVAKALGYKRPNDAVNAHCRATVKHSTLISGKMQDINFIPEGDIYRLIIRSKLSSAENNVPYQKYIDNGLFKVIEVTKKSAYDDERIYTKTLVTGKGQVYILEKLKAEND